MVLQFIQFQFILVGDVSRKIENSVLGVIEFVSAHVLWKDKNEWVVLLYNFGTLSIQNKYLRQVFK